MELRQLRYFVAIVDHGSLSRAARVLHIAQPALTQQIRQLEDEMAAQLLHRSAAIPARAQRALVPFLVLGGVPAAVRVAVVVVAVISISTPLAPRTPSASRIRTRFSALPVLAERRRNASSTEPNRAPRRADTSIRESTRG